MYLPDTFRNDRIEQLHQVMIDHPLCTIVTHGPDGFDANPVPVFLEENPKPYGCLLGHFTKANPMTKLPSGTQALAIFNGPNQYVTPAWYPSKQKTGKVVPTWNYVTVHAHGTLDFFEDPTSLLSLVTSLTDRHEADRPDPWKVSDAPPDYIQTMLKGIVGFRFLVSRLEGKWKISQNRTLEDRNGVTQGLARSGSPDAHTLSNLMSKDD
jgi:transcriptional regulator